ncbi:MULTISPECIES: hypothetical protein [Pseudomonas]|uniref:Flagellar biosynthesis/type III secretory pathway protein FliH n=1 Tax=Pseudomonas hunanensis TaxID=1247546 RepID=A0ACC6K103_9PSED|nr:MULTISPECIES: hypothetical protein [Pseudomonas]MBP2260287.1 flagellar biosynthesis/type III secretory pathway protein FliH [Pseudomonas sp. BP8]MDR6712139.1 flagellar biosynthesis/type III secretory pathway protein FliH [Pseudomonas hunanensis]HDS1733909.1 hypothetical protein [Pseudomonas putida]
MDHNWAGRKSNMSLDGGYNGSFQQAEANLHVGRQQGRQEGFEQGRSNGYSEGWDAGRDYANQKLEPLRDLVRQYFSETVELRGIAKQLTAVVEQMHEQYLQVVAKANEANRTASAEEARLAREVAALKDDIELKKLTMKAMERQFNSTYAQSELNTEQYNRSVIFAQVAQWLLEEIVAEDTPEAGRIRERFVERYQEQVALHLREGYIFRPPEQDPTFQKKLPSIHQFILDMQASVAPRQQADDSDPAD